jgi:hypothetical protein
MDFATAINAQLICSIAEHLGCSLTYARKVLKGAKATARALGLPLAEVLHHMDVVA